ncbi:hypothetical protein H4219_003168 [Mycoemilia scoparia]|uniref:Programmed cell death protein 2 C-terminal domain-containing protein n=1 Tax=Mycoemilia scoparia TaxID=417184 RepID=A0A9W8A241_9FUNG|nr:hypothetical protein H4219_003168 [Mycoemilia scoparia]
MPQKSRKHVPVLLGFADGVFDTSEDIYALESKIGGRPFSGVWNSTISSPPTKVSNAPVPKTVDSGIGNLTSIFALKTSISETSNKNVKADSANDKEKSSTLYNIDGNIKDWEGCESMTPMYLDICEDVTGQGATYDIDINYIMEDNDIGASASPGDKGKEDPGTWAGEKYEHHTFVKGTDAAFERFLETMAENPEQCIRYSYNGVPLFYTHMDDSAKLLNKLTNTPQSSLSSVNDSSDSDDDEGAHGFSYSTTNIEPCKFCGGQRVFEFQLMPALLTALPLEKFVKKESNTANVEDNAISNKKLTGKEFMNQHVGGMEIGTLFVFTCENDCHSGKKGLEYLNLENLNDFQAAEYYDEIALSQVEIHC